MPDNTPEAQTAVAEKDLPSYEPTERAKMYVLICEAQEIDPIANIEDRFTESPTQDELTMYREVAEYLAYRRGCKDGAEAARVELKDQIAEYDEMVGHVFGMLIHNIRRPITLQRGYADMIIQILQEAPITEKNLRTINLSAETISKSATFMTEIVATIQALAGEIEYGMAPEEQQVRSIFEHSVGVYGKEGYRYQLDINIAEDVDQKFVPTQLVNEVLRQTLSNAIKYGAQPDKDESNICVRFRQEYVETIDEEVLVVEVVNSRDKPLPDGFMHELNSARMIIPEGTIKPSLGIGLILTRFFCDKNGVSIEADNEGEINGTKGNPRFKIIFPTRTLQSLTANT